MNVLVICDDQWHPARTARAGLAPLSNAEITFDWIENANEWSAERMAKYPVTLMTKANNVSATDKTPWVTEAVQEAFLAYVQAGNGLLVVHSGTAGYREMPVLRGLIGGVFVSHPPQCPVTVEPLAGHPLTVGAELFTLVDEHYFMEFDDQQADCFVTTRSEHGTQPAGWTRFEGAGRVCMLSPGHNVEVWLHPSFQALLQNTLQWCAGSLARQA